MALTGNNEMEKRDISKHAATAPASECKVNEILSAEQLVLKYMYSHI